MRGGSLGLLLLVHAAVVLQQTKCSDVVGTQSATSAAALGDTAEAQRQILWLITLMSGRLVHPRSLQEKDVLEKGPVALENLGLQFAQVCELLQQEHETSDSSSLRNAMGKLRDSLLTTEAYIRYFQHEAEVRMSFGKVKGAVLRLYEKVMVRSK